MRLRSGLLLITLAGCSAPPAPSTEVFVNPDDVRWLDLGRSPISVDLAWTHVWPDLTRLPPSVDQTRPVVRCGGDAGADDGGIACAPPPSRCADQDWLMYYTNGTCVRGHCVWEQAFLDCTATGESCRNNGCASNATL